MNSLFFDFRTGRCLFCRRTLIVDTIRAIFDDKYLLPTSQDTGLSAETKFLLLITWIFLGPLSLSLVRRRNCTIRKGESEGRRAAATTGLAIPVEYIFVAVFS